MMEFTVAEAVPLLIVAALLLRHCFGPVTRARLARFAQRERLDITAGNAADAVGYLATTRRWRCGGLLSVSMLAAVWTAAGSRAVHFDLVVAFGGWFAGALIAEWRVAGPSVTGRRAASLQPRKMTDYLELPALVLPVVVWLVVVPFALVAAWRLGGNHPALALRVVLDVLAAVATAAIVLVVAQRVLRRPQPLVEPDRRAADDAMRRRSLHVLAGCAIAIGGYLGVGVAAALSSPRPGLEEGTANLLSVVGGLFLPILAVMTALAPRGARSPRPVAVAG